MVHVDLRICLIVILTLHGSSDLASAANDGCDRLKNLEYEYFGTKTVYNVARKFLSKADDDDLPRPFDDDSMAKEHREMREDHCKPLMFYFIGRHSARFPDGEDIEKYNSDLARLVEKLKSNPKCSSSLQQFIDWKSKMVPKHDNLITELGAREERDIARRFKQLYPEFFDAQKTDVNIGVTNRIRTAQTGAQFLSQVDGLNLPHCDDASLPTNDVDKPNYNLDQVLNALCYKNMTAKYLNSNLDFHKKCDQISGKSKKVKDPLVERVKSPKLSGRIADRVARKLGFEDHNSSDPAAPVTPDVLDSIWNMCKFENAIMDDSVWCDLFEKKDIQALEYIEDVNSYIKNAYGPEANVRQTCPMIGHLLDSFQKAIDTGDRKAYFYFSHAGPMKKLLAALNLFKDDYSFGESSVSDFERELKPPKRRNWRTSLIVPFSGNLAFVLYKCQKPHKAIKYKVLTMVNEQPVKLSACGGDTDCNVRKYFDAFDQMRSCNLEEICKS